MVRDDKAVPALARDGPRGPAVDHRADLLRGAGVLGLAGVLAAQLVGARVLRGAVVVNAAFRLRRGRN